MKILKKASFRHSQLTVAPETEIIDPTTEQLFLDGNMIEVLPDDIDKLQKLQILDLSKCNGISDSQCDY